MLEFSEGVHFHQDPITDTCIRGEGSLVTTVYCPGIYLEEGQKGLDIRGVKFVGTGEGVGLHSKASGRAYIEDVHICNYQHQMIMEHTGSGIDAATRKIHWFHHYKDLYLGDRETLETGTRKIDTTGLTLIYTGTKEPLGGWDGYNFFNTVSITKGYIKADKPVFIDGPTSIEIFGVYMESGMPEVALEITDRSSGLNLFGCTLENKEHAPIMKVYDPKFCRVRMYGAGTSGLVSSGRCIDKHGENPGALQKIISKYMINKYVKSSPEGYYA